MTICTLGDDVLRKKAEPIAQITPELVALAKEMLAQLKISQGIGLAAPQIGLSQRMFVIDVDDGVQRVFFNPQILETSAEMCSYEEGCLSLPKVWNDVIRPARVKIQAYNEAGKPFTLEADGILARCIQHEYDHLDGLLFIDRIDPAERERIVAAYQKKRAKLAKKRRK